MGRMSILSLGLFVLPIAATLGVLLGLDAFRSSRGQTPLFVSNNVKTSIYCQRAFGVTPPSDGQQFTLNPNQWGWNDGDPGALCMNVTAFANGTYPTLTTAPEWSITWQYPQGPPTQPVHAFPNIKMDSGDIFPVQISNVVEMPMEAEWYYGVGDTLPEVLDAAALTAVDLNSNVAIDMFVDSDPNKATSTVDAKYEVMIWLGTFGAATQPIGLAQGPRATQVINGTTFNLYFGVNGLEQTVLTWTATGTISNFVADVGPLLQGLTGIGGPTTSDYLGYVAFGSEALYSLSNVTLSVPHLRMNVTTTK